MDDYSRQRRSRTHTANNVAIKGTKPPLRYSSYSDINRAPQHKTPHRNTRRRNAGRRQKPKRNNGSTKRLLITCLILTVIIVSIAGAITYKKSQAKKAEELRIKQEKILIEEEKVKIVEKTLPCGIKYKGPNMFSDSSEAKHLADAINKCVSKGYLLGVYCFDINTGNYFEFDADSLIHGASSIKAPYCAAILDTNAYAKDSEKSRVEASIIWSDNETYKQLRARYGDQIFKDWSENHAPQTNNQRVTYYPQTTARELAGSWKKIYIDKDNLPQYFFDACSKTQNSPLGDLLRDNYKVYSKPGWYPEDRSGCSSTTDAGIVISDCGPYIIAVITNKGQDFKMLNEICDACNMAHGALCAGSTKSMIDTSKQDQIS